jgi:hypothetical protein
MLLQASDGTAVTALAASSTPCVPNILSFSSPSSVNGLLFFLCLSVRPIQPHCWNPLMDKNGISGRIRASLGDPLLGLTAAKERTNWQRSHYCKKDLSDAAERTPLKC